MKGKVYYWIAIGVLSVTTVFCFALAKIQRGYAVEAAERAQEAQRLSIEQVRKAEAQMQLAIEQAKEAQAARDEVQELQLRLEICENSK